METKRVKKSDEKDKEDGMHIGNKHLTSKGRLRTPKENCTSLGNMVHGRLSLFSQQGPA